MSQCARCSTSWWSSLTFGWVDPLMRTGVQRQLEQSDLLPVPEDLAPELCCGQLWQCWQEECTRHSQNPLLLRAIFCAYGLQYVLIGVLKVLC